ncbi:hypothetical protein [Flavobacterium sp. 25HG05S-40]|uniref:hypothetical protein n=1 Tax=Flavobacterium sp. 25HG05S-40 TaxID=3458682 RepID=UPI004044E1D1
MKTKITLLLVFFSLTLWSQTSSGTGTGTMGGGGGGIKVTISSTVNSQSIEILPDLDVANVIGYKIYDSNFELKKEENITPTNNEIIVIENLEKDKYFIQLFLDKEEQAKWVITKQFIKE